MQCHVTGVRVECGDNLGLRFPIGESLVMSCMWKSEAGRSPRAVEARIVLAPALDGFAPTLEMPEIAEAQALLVRLA